MNLPRTWALMLGLVLSCLIRGFAAEPDVGQEAAIAVIKKSGGYVFRRGNRLEVYFSGSRVTDADLAELKGLDDLSGLALGSTLITDGGLTHLKGLSELEWLWLRNTQISDAGLEHVAGLSGLSKLNLSETKITDTGLEHLKGLSNLPV